MGLLPQVLAIAALHFPLRPLALECSDARCRSDLHVDDAFSLMQVKQTVGYSGDRQADDAPAELIPGVKIVPGKPPSGSGASHPIQGPSAKEMKKIIKEMIPDIAGLPVPAMQMPPNDESSVMFPPSTATAGIMQSTKAKVPKDLRLLSFNLCWECQSASVKGSGKVASIHCEPSSTDPSKLVTSCSANMLKYMKSWHRTEPFDVVVFLELCNPGVNSIETMKWGGFDQSRPDKAQCSIAWYEQMKKTLDDGRPDDEKFVFVLNQQRSSHSTQHILTGYKKSTFADYLEPIIVRTTVAPGRPMTALIFEKKRGNREKVMIISIHNIHYRKALINNKLVPSLKGVEDPTGLLKYARDHYKLAGGTCSEESLLTDRPKCFSMDYFPTAALAKLFGGFVEKRIRGAIEDQVTLDGISRVIMAGDFNDETGELFNLPLFADNIGKNVMIKADQRKRTCCSNRDERWLKEYGKWWEMTNEEERDPKDAKVQQQVINGDWTTADAYPEHAEATLDYMLKQCKYASGACAMPGLTLSGAQYAPENSGILAAQEKHSRYPFPSDLILDSEGVKSFGFPPDYKQALGTETMSDHDPVVATLAPLP